MARISLIEPDQASPEVKEIYDGKLKAKPGSIQKALAHRPAMLGNFLGFYASVGRTLDRKLYEAVYLRTSLINGCHYCTQHHIQGSKRAGLTPDQMKALKGGDYSGFAAPEQTALRYAEKLARGSAHADRTGQPHQSRDGAAGVGRRVSGRKALTTGDIEVHREGRFPPVYLYVPRG